MSRVLLLIHFAKFFEQWQFNQVSIPLSGSFAGDDVSNVKDRKTTGGIHEDFSFVIVLDPIRRKHQIDIERPALDLHKILAANDLVLEIFIHGKTKLSQCLHAPLSAVVAFSWEDIHILRCSRITEQNRAALAYEHVINVVLRKSGSDLFGLCRIEGLTPHHTPETEQRLNDRNLNTVVDSPGTSVD